MFETKNTISSSFQYKKVLSIIQDIVSGLLGINSSDTKIHINFLEMGVDSLLLLQINRAIQKELGINIPFRLLLEDLSTIEVLATHIAQKLSPENLTTEPLAEEPILNEPPILPISDTQEFNSKDNKYTLFEQVIVQQLQLMSRQLDLLHKAGLSKKNVPLSAVNQFPDLTNKWINTKTHQEPVNSAASQQIAKESSTGLNSRQQKHLNTLIARVVERTKESKRLTQAYRFHHANSRAVTGFLSSIKEMLYPIHGQRGEGARLWDVDGNEYVDISMGFGTLLFGHSPSFIIEAIEKQIQQGLLHGPQSALSGKVAELICELTGAERAALCNDGTEAVMGAIRLARAVTRRSKIALFSGSYHGTYDGVLVRGITTSEGTRRSIPGVIGIPSYIAEDVIVLDYGSPKSLDILRNCAHELAAILVEPIQSSQPDLQPKEFVHKLRQITQETGTVLIFDEVITGFRMHPGGIQALWNIQADITTYGKAVAAGMPIGVIAGKAAFLDALDGGMWYYGDASYPQAETTLFAGTFFKHPLAMAAAWATLNHIKNSGTKLQEDLAQKTTKLAETLNSYFEQKQVPLKVVHFGSLFRFATLNSLKFGNLFFYHLLEKGVYVWEGRTFYLSTAHTNKDIEHLIWAVKESVAEMQLGEFFPPSPISLTDIEPIKAPLTEAQKELWFVAQMGNEASRAYNESRTIHLRGHFNLSAIHKAVQETVNRHEALRTTFSSEGDYQLINSSVIIEIPFTDLSSFNTSDRNTNLSELLAKEAQQVFNLEQGPLLRSHLIKLEEQHHLLVITNHHIVADGWSIGILLRELAAIYIAESQSTTYQLPQPMRWSKYALWQAHLQESPEMAKAEAYWLKQFADLVPVLELPTDRPRPSVFTHVGARENIILDTSIYTAIKNLSARSGCTLFTILFAGFTALLQRLTAQQDIVIGIPSAGQSFAESEYLVGHCVNLLPIRTQVVGNPTFTEYLSSVKQVLLDAYDYHIYPFIRLIKNLNLPRDPSRTPLITTTFNLDKALSESDSFSKTVKLVRNLTSAAKYDIAWNINQTDNELLVECEYNTDLFDSQTIQRWLGHFRTLLEGIVANPKQPVSELPLLTATEQQNLLVEWNNTQAEYSSEQCIHQLFEAQVERTPDAIALIFEDQHLTYRELNQRANQLAHYLQKLGVGAEVLVGICIERSLNMIIGLLAILKAGGAYIPLDPTYPKERLGFILDDAQMSVLLTQSHLRKNLPEHQTRVVCLDTDWRSIAQQSQDNPVSDSTSDNLAYIIYTSGSTGQPKGVLINHANVVRLFAAVQSWYHFNQQDIWTLFHSYAFDFSVWELWGALFYGGRLVVVPYWVSRSPEDFYKLLLTQQVTVLNQTPSAFRQLIQAEDSVKTTQQLSLRLVIFGGEALELESLRPWFERHGDQFPQLVNMYGITETTVHVTYRPLTIKDLEVTPRSVIGRPIPDLQLYLLDRYLQPVPIGVTGEMHIGGAGLARGYLNRPELTAARFIPDPFSKKANARLYKSGDLACYLPNGDIEYLGRIDHQVKIRGFRIELGEIENAIAKYQAVRETVVLARESQYSDKLLVAYIVPSNKQTLVTSDLRNFLQKHLPEYMVPSTFVVLEALPLTPNGKVDHRRLPAPDAARPELEEVFVAPCTFHEKVLAEIWAKVIGIEQVGIHDNFFSLGGDSIRSIQVQSLAKEQGLKFSIQQLFQHQTIYELAKTFSTTQESTANAKQIESFSLISKADQLNLTNEIEDAYPLSQLQAGMFFHSIYSSNATIFHNVTSLHLKARFDLGKMQIAIEQLAARHAILRTSFDLGNFSEPIQLVHKTVSIPLQVEDLRHFSITEQEKVLTVWFEAERSHKFDWTHPPLLRFQIHRRSQETFQFSFTEHHAILDGWSVASMMTELFEHYYFLQGENLALPYSQPATAYRDFIALERKALASEECQRYWSEKLKDSTMTILPRWQISHQVAENEIVGVHRVPLSSEVSNGLIQLAQLAGVPLKSVLLAAHLRVLMLLSGQSDVLTGLVSNGRPEETDGERVLGLFLNTLPFRLQLSGGTWIDLVQKTFEAEREFLPYRRYPLAELQRHLGQKSLFETAFNFTNFHVYQSILRLKDTQLQILDTKSCAEADFTFFTQFNLDPSLSQLRLHLDYDRREFGSEQIAAIGGYYAKALANMASEPKNRYEFHCLLATSEQHQLLVNWNNTQVKYPQDQCIHQLFEAQVERTPDAIALIFEEQQLTYRELNQRANQLAHYLQKLGVGAEVLVGICLERSLNMIIGLLGILKAGGAYIPLDPAYPQQRLAFMLSDTQVSVLLTQQHLVEKLPEHNGQVICLDSHWESIAENSQQNPQSNTTADNLAYVIYTSGSTGQPKGVQGLHQGAINRFQWMWQNYPFMEGEVCCQKTSLNFVDSVWEIFGALLQGVTTVIVPDEVAKNSQQFVSTLASNQVTRLLVVPSLLRVLLATDNELELQLPKLKMWVTSGEALSIDLLQEFRRILPNSSLLNLYGSSEVSADVTCWCIEPQMPIPSSVMIGKAIANTQIYLLDQQQQLVPIGVPGELYVGGAGLARGYLNRPEMTTQRFISNPFDNSKSNRLYKTGDLARYLPDGNLEYLGRIDDQVKLRGFRIELGEIESVIQQLPVVKETVVLAREDEPNNKQLVAYVVLHPQQIITISELHHQLKQKLPDYMMPSVFVTLEALPLLPNGKVDRLALPVPDQTRPKLEATYQPPQTEIEQTIAKIWQEVLNIEDVGIYDNFFELGGHSLLLIQVYSKLQNTFNQDLSLVGMFQYPTINHLAKYLSEQSNQEQVLIDYSHRVETRKASIERRKKARQKLRSAINQPQIDE